MNGHPLPFEAGTEPGLQAVWHFLFPGPSALRPTARFLRTNKTKQEHCFFSAITEALAGLVPDFHA
jgi:hypothetical protein